MRKHYKKDCLSGKIYCNICGAGMVYSRTGRLKYECKRNYNLPHAERHERNSVLVEDRKRHVLCELEHEAALYADSAYVREQFKASYEKQVEKEIGKLKECEAELEKIILEQDRLYDDYKAGVIDRDAYDLAVKRLDEEERRAQEAVAVNRKAFEGLEDKKVRAHFMEASENCGITWDDGKLHFTEFTPELVKTFIKKITVSPGGDMEIAWRFKKN